MCWQWEAPTSGTEWLNRAGPTIAFHLDDSKEYRDSFRDAEGDLKIMLFVFYELRDAWLECNYFH